MITAVSATLSGSSASSRTSATTSGMAMLTARGASRRMAIHQMPSTNRATGTLTASAVPTCPSSASPENASICSSIPAENAAAAANTT